MFLDQELLKLHMLFRLVPFAILESTCISLIVRPNNTGVNIS